MEGTTVLAVRDVSKRFPSPDGESELTVVSHASFSVAAGESVSIVGHSGSGKTTLLGLCAGLDRVSAGSIELAGRALEPLSEDARARLRAEHTGFVFQNFQLVPTLTALENVMVPAELLGALGGPSRSTREIRTQAASLLENVGLGGRQQHYATQLSGGEQQRVALARAFINRPQILFADEPTGNLDGETSERITELLFNLNREAGTALVLVTHNLELAARTGRQLRMKDGILAA
ncbi:MAG: ABC transporter ATP-binding protein [Verrucomicrobia bacterium]|nr:ABC transporter ATP-binding protein [Verrucomicrobiota bacterium]